MSEVGDINVGARNLGVGLGLIGVGVLAAVAYKKFFGGGKTVHRCVACPHTSRASCCLSAVSRVPGKWVWDDELPGKSAFVFVFVFAFAFVLDGGWRREALLGKAVPVCAFACVLSMGRRRRGPS